MIYILFFLFSLGSLGRISFFNQEVNLYIYEVLYVIFLLYLIANYRLAPYKTYLRQMTPVYIFLIVLTVTYGISLFRFSVYQNFVSFLYFARLAMYLKGIPYIAYHLKARKKEYINAVRMYAILTAAGSIIQYLFYPNLRNLQYLGWDPHLYRMFGVVFDVSYAAALYGLVILFFYFLDKKYGLVALFYALLGLLTYDRAFYLSLISAATAYLVSIKKYVLIAGIIMIVAGALLLLPKKAGEGVNLLRTSTISSRLVDYQSGITLFEKNPLIGVGYDHIRYLKGQSEANHAGAGFHSSFLVVAVASGLIGLAAFLYMLWSFAIWGKLAFYSVIFLSVFSLFDNIWLHPFVLFFEVWLLAFVLSNKKK